MKKVIISYSLEPELVAQLRRLSKISMISMSRLVEEGIRWVISNPPAKPREIRSNEE